MHPTHRTTIACLLVGCSICAPLVESFRERVSREVPEITWYAGEAPSSSETHQDRPTGYEELFLSEVAGISTLSATAVGRPGEFTVLGPGGKIIRYP